MCVLSSLSRGHHGERGQEDGCHRAGVFCGISSPVLVFFCLCKTLHKPVFTEKKRPCVQDLAWCPALTLPPQQGRAQEAFPRLSLTAVQEGKLFVQSKLTNSP